MIKFGTDGWRAKIAEEFTFENVEKVTAAFVKYLESEDIDPRLRTNGVAVGYDNRFQSEHFAKTAAEVCAKLGIKTFLTEYAVSSPLLSFAVAHNKLAAGIMITASHNPPEWNGFKIKESFGGSARPEVTRAVEKNLSYSLPTPMPTPAPLFPIDPKPDYFAHIEKLVDLKAIAESKVRAVVDPMFGSGAHHIKELLGKYGMEVEEIHANRDPLFGGVNPEPLPINLLDTISFMSSYKDPFSTCIVLDGDGDRVSAIDPSGTFITSHNVFSLLLKHLVENRKMAGLPAGRQGKIVKTFNISRLVEKQAKKYGLEIIETPIGFKYIADLMLKEKIIIGGEESGGMGIMGHLPERDGTLCGLLLLELMAKSGLNLKQLLDQIMDELGYYYYSRIDLHLSSSPRLRSMETFAGRKITKIETLDGTKLNFEDEAWILFRPSGTEPLLRIYAEARKMGDVNLLLAEGEKMATSNTFQPPG